MKTRAETQLPLQKLQQLSTTEKAGKGHPWNLHLWWNRSPLAASRELLRAALTGENGQPSQKLPTLCDPFSGSGSLVLAAEQLGLTVQAGDLNGVAALITKAVGELPARFAGKRAVHPASAALVYNGTDGLREDVQFYGDELKEMVRQKLQVCYPDKTYAWIWVRTMPCPNPACGCELPLGNSFILSETKGREFWAEPVYTEGRLQFKVHQGLCPKGKETNKHGSRGSRFQCPVCGTLTKDEEVKEAGKQGILKAQLLAVALETENGRIYVEPDGSQLAAAQISMVAEPPQGSISCNTRWFAPPEFGMKEFADLYTPRQLLLLTSFCDSLQRLRKEIKKDALKAGLQADEIPLAQGGKGALAYSEAIGVYLALVISKLSNYQSTFCSWDHRNGNIRVAFNRQALSMTWTFAEGNPFGQVTGNYDSLLKQVTEALTQLPVTVKATVAVLDARKFLYPKNSILFTELPYYDTVGYGDLSDYFYVWLRRCLKGIYPELFTEILSQKNELASIVEPFSGDAVQARQKYEQEVTSLFTDFYPSASTEFPSIVFFRYGAEDEAAIAGRGEPNRLSPLENLLQGILQAGFCITALWPARTEKVRKNDSLRIAVVFRKGIQQRPRTTRRNFIQALKRELQVLLDTALKKVEKEDWNLVGLGFGLQILGNFSAVINADGSDLGIHAALQLIAQEVTNYQEEKEAETPPMKEG